MNKLQQLKQRSQVVADSGDIEAIRHYCPQDATTNPSLLYKAAQLPQYRDLVEQSLIWAQKFGDEQIPQAAIKLAVAIGSEILQLIPGVVSTEVDARLSFDIRNSVDYARRLITLYQQTGISRQRVLIKLAATWEGISAASILEQEGIRCNLTLLFSQCQAIACAEAGVTLISPFVGRILDWHKTQSNCDTYTAETDPGVQSVRAIYTYYKSRSYPTIVMGASFRNQGEIEALAGCDRLTISPQLLEKLQADQAPLEGGLNDAITPQARPANKLEEAEFRLHLNNNAMASEKLAEGIRNFIHDQQRLEQFLEKFQRAN
ncbi:MAG: transaldolase [Gammaproteobacteria bacterium]|nr:transaldolase [Gammaproteobacteria bacterium]